jgi:hypothetical protein
MCSEPSGHGRRRHGDMQACSVWYGAVYYSYSSGPLGPLHSADPTSGRGQNGITAQAHLTALEEAGVIPGKHSDTRIKLLALTNNHGRYMLHYMTVTPNEHSRP